MIRSLLVSLLVTNVCLAQTPASSVRQLGLGTGLSLGAARYEGMSQLVQRGKAFPLQLYFLSQGHHNRHFVQLQTATYAGGLTSRYEESTTELSTGHLQYAYHRCVGELKQWFIWVGPVVNLQASLPSFAARVGNTHYRNSSSPALLNSLSISALVSRNVGQGRLEGQVWMHALGYNIRPNYAYAYTNVNSFSEWVSSGAIETWPLFGQLNARIAYDGYLSPHFRLRLDYQWQYGRAKTPRYTGMLTNQFLTSLAYQF